MTDSVQMRPARRAPRIGLRGTIAAIIQLENGRQLPAGLHQLSVTGGLLDVTTYLEERTRVGLTIPIGSSVVRPQAEMLFPMWSSCGYLQPFRFTVLWAEQRQILEMEITQLLKQTVTRSIVGRGPSLMAPRFYLESF